MQIQYSEENIFLNNQQCRIRNIQLNKSNMKEKIFRVKKEIGKKKKKKYLKKLRNKIVCTCTCNSVEGRQHTTCQG